MNTFIQSRKYAQALFSISENKQQDYDNLKLIANNWQDIAKIMPMYLPDVKKVEQVNSFDVSLQIRSMLVLLSKRGLFRLLNQIANEFENELFGEENIVKAQIYSAKELTEEQIVKLCSSFEHKLNKKIIASSIVDPKLIGGVKIKVGNDVYDDTIITKLNLLEQMLIKETEVTL